MTWIKFSGFLTSPLSAFGTNLWSCTSTTMSDFKVPPLPQSRDHLCMVRYSFAVAMTYRLHDYLSGKRLHNSLPAASTVRIEFALVRNLPCAGSWHCIFRKANCLWTIFPSSSPLAFTSKNGCASSFIQNIVSQYHCTNDQCEFSSLVDPINPIYQPIWPHRARSWSAKNVFLSFSLSAASSFHFHSACLSLSLVAEVTIHCPIKWLRSLQ